MRTESKMKGEKMKKRVLWLDYVRAFSIFLVVLTHSIEGVYALSREAVLANSTISKIFLFGAFNLTRHGVPLFLMISGWLLLSRNFVLKASDADPNEKTYYCVDFWKNNLLRLLITVEIWIVIYHIYFMIMDQAEFDFVKLLRQMLLIDGLGLSHEWYIYAILAIYAFLPFVAYVLNHIDLKNLVFPIVLTVMVAFVLPSLTTILNTHVDDWDFSKFGSPAVYSRMNLYYSGGAYGFYLLCGYLVRKKVFSKIKSRYLILISVLSFVAGTAFQWESYLYSDGYLIWYDFFTLLPACVSIFELCSRIQFRENLFSELITNISRASFGIYLVHNLFLICFFRYVKLNFKLPINVCAYCVVAFLCSWCLINLISKIPKVGKYISYM